MNISEHPSQHSLRGGGTKATHEPENQQGGPIWSQSTGHDRERVHGKGRGERNLVAERLAQRAEHNRTKYVTDEERCDGQGDLLRVRDGEMLSHCGCLLPVRFLVQLSGF